MALPASFKVAESIDEAFERIGFAPEQITVRHVVSARRSIRLMLADWNTDQVLFWKVAAARTSALTLSADDFSPAADVIDILDMAVRRDNIDIPMQALSRSQWFALPDKIESQAMPTHYWVERLATGVTVHIYPKSENATDVLVYDAMLYFDDTSALASSTGLVERWNPAFTAGLTYHLSEKFARQMMAEKLELYGGPNPPRGVWGAYQRAKTGDRERGETRITIARGRGRR